MKLPLFISRSKIVLPGLPVTLKVGRQFSLLAIKASQDNNSNQIILTHQTKQGEAVKAIDISSVGVKSTITEFKFNEDSPSVVSFLTFQRVKLSKIKETKQNYFEAEYENIIATNTKHKDLDKRKKTLAELFKNQVLAIAPQSPVDQILGAVMMNDEKFIDTALIYLSLTDKDLEWFLGETDMLKLFNKAIKLYTEKSFKSIYDLTKNIKVPTDFMTKMTGGTGVKNIIDATTDEEISKASKSKVKNQISNKVNDKLNKQQQEFLLREQAKAIQDELDEISGDGSETEQMKQKIETNPYPKEIKAKLLKELKRFEQTPQASAESGVIRTYLETMLDLPWWEMDDEEVEISKVIKQLDKDHYGLEKPKERIIEYIAVKQSNPSAKGPILTLVGPPGTGKTSIAKSIAKALNKKFIKVSLGGIKDEAEIRGHRKTYLGSMPGKIIQGMKRVGVLNPVMLLDEIDKMSSDYKGDPTSAMLEVLDPEQNATFQDHYIEEEYDLSHVTFIATANYIQDIPYPLLDRMEIIELNSYTSTEKLQIAKRHLIPEVLTQTKIDKKLFKLTDAQIKVLITNYTMEAGVRQIYRVLEKVARKILVKSLKNELDPTFKITDEVIFDFLGPKKVEATKKDSSPQVGATQGLAVTSVGGDILPIEVTLIPGEGKLIITGQLKDVMSESAQIALSFVKSNAEKFGIPEERLYRGEMKHTFKDFNIHVHSPDGSTPKDGPSAGVTFTTSLISALTGKPVSQNIAMTGEITLRGKVLPIGGLKEKSLAAYNAKIKQIFIPYDNKKNMVDMVPEVVKGLKVVPVKSYWEIFEQVFVTNEV